MSLQSRLDRLQGPPVSEIRLLTDDELEIRFLDLSRSIAADEGASPVDRAAAAANVEEIENGIRAQARMRRQPSYAKHLAWVQGKRPVYVPAICGFNGGMSSMAEYRDIFKPDIMARRAALLTRPDIQALIATA